MVKYLGINGIGTIGLVNPTPEFMNLILQNEILRCRVFDDNILNSSLAWL